MYPQTQRDATGSSRSALNREDPDKMANGCDLVRLRGWRTKNYERQSDAIGSEEEFSAAGGNGQNREKPLPNLPSHWSAHLPARESVPCPRGRRPALRGAMPTPTAVSACSVCSCSAPSLYFMLSRKSTRTRSVASIRMRPKRGNSRSRMTYTVPARISAKPIM